MIHRNQWGHWNYPLIGSSQVNHNKVFIFRILFFLFLFFKWVGWPSGMTGNTHAWKILISNPTDGLGQDGLWDPHSEAPDNLQVEHHLTCVSLTISYPLFFLFISKVLSMLHHGSVGWFDSKECYSIRFSKGRGNI